MFVKPGHTLRNNRNKSCETWGQKVCSHLGLQIVLQITACSFRDNASDVLQQSRSCNIETHGPKKDASTGAGREKSKGPGKRAGVKKNNQ